MSEHAIPRLRGLSAIALIATMYTNGCGGASDGGGTTPSSSCRVTAIIVTPGTVSLAVGETRDLFTSFQETNCTTDPAVVWTNGNSSAVSLQPDGEVAHVTGVAATGQPVTVTAKVGSLTATSQITVTSGPLIRLTPDTLVFTAVHNAANEPPVQTVALTNGGGGTLSQVGPTATVYGPGASGWLFVNKSILTSVAPFNLNVQPTNTSLAAGTYTATIPVTSPVASNSPQNVTVIYTVTGGGAAPTISNLALTLVSVNSCTSSGNTGNTFKVSFSFSDPAGDSFTGAVLETFVFQPSGVSGNLSFSVPSSSVSVANGTMTLGACVIFGSSTSLNLTVALQSSSSGQTSNSLTVNVPKPAGGAGASAASFTLKPAGPS